MIFVTPKTRLLSGKIGDGALQHVNQPTDTSIALTKKHRAQSEEDKSTNVPPVEVAAPAESKATTEPISRQPVARGQALSFQRTATEDELCLSVQAYAKILARLFRLPDPSDFCLAIFGFWGRGKTFLLEQTANVINAQAHDDNDHYEVVFFRAWKYPSRPRFGSICTKPFFRNCEIGGGGNRSHMLSERGSLDTGKDDY
jgi:hypothetical protein